MSKKYETLIDEDTRRAVLALLYKSPNYTANSSMLKLALGTLGHTVSTDKLLTLLHWLQEQGLVELMEATLLLVRLTTRGADVLTGAVTVPGVAAQSPY